MDEQWQTTLQGSPIQANIASHTLTETIVDWCCFNEAPTCSTCNQEDEAQMRGHLFNVWTWKTAQEGLKSLLEKDRCKFRIKSEMNRQFYKMYRNVVSSVERGVTNAGDKDKYWRPTYYGGMSDECWQQWQKNCDVGEFNADCIKGRGSIVRWDVTMRDNWCHLGVCDQDVFGHGSAHGVWKWCCDLYAFVVCRPSLAYVFYGCLTCTSNLRN